MVTYGAVDPLSLSMYIFQFFTKPKPPKGYYIYGDVGKRHVVKEYFLSIQTFFVTCLLLCLVYTPDLFLFLFFYLRHRENYGDGHVLFVRRDGKEKAGSFPWIYVGRA